MEDIGRLLPLLVPILLLELALLAIALLAWFRQRRRGEPQWGWLIVIVLINFFGPIAYLLFGRKD
jgi:hypothetical protein